MDTPEELKYTREHFWIRQEGNTAVVGLTDFIQDLMGIVDSVELPTEGDEVEQDDAFGMVEARNGVSELYAPFSGTVLEVNSELLDNPALINDDPYDSGWLAEIEINDPDEFKSLLSVDEYLDFLEDQET